MKKFLLSIFTGIFGIIVGYLTTAFNTVMPTPCDLLNCCGGQLIKYSNCSAYQLQGLWEGETTSPKGRYPVRIRINAEPGNIVNGTHNAFQFSSVSVQPGGQFNYTFTDTDKDRYYSSTFMLAANGTASIQYTACSMSDRGRGRIYEGTGRLRRTH